MNALLKAERSADHFICDWELEGVDLNEAKRFLDDTQTTIEDIVDLAAIESRQAQSPK